jgi:hypothetical protein
MTHGIDHNTARALYALYGVLLAYALFMYWAF